MLGPAESLAATDTLRTVEDGKVADLVLPSANPLDDVAKTRRLEGVVTRGWLFDREALDERLKVAEGPQGSANSLCRQGERFERLRCGVVSGWVFSVFVDRWNNVHVTLGELSHH